MSVIVYLVVSPTVSIKRKFESLDKIGLSEELSYLNYAKKLDEGIHSESVNIKGEHLYISSERKNNDIDEQSDIVPIDVYFKGALIISGFGNFDDDVKSVTLGDGSNLSTDYYFNTKMWEKLSIISGESVEKG